MLRERVDSLQVCPEPNWVASRYWQCSGARRPLTCVCMPIFPPNSRALSLVSAVVETWMSSQWTLIRWAQVRCRTRSSGRKRRRAPPRQSHAAILRPLALPDPVTQLAGKAPRHPRLLQSCPRRVRPGAATPRPPSALLLRTGPALWDGFPKRCMLYFKRHPCVLDCKCCLFSARCISVAALSPGRIGQPAGA